MSDPYHDWVKEAWKEVDRAFASGMFSPRNESDIQTQLYHCMLETKPEKYRKDKLLVVTTEWKVPNEEKIVDLAIVRIRNASQGDARNGTDELRLLLEVKETSSEELSADEVKNRIQRDIEKMATALRLGSAWVSTYTRRLPVMTFFFRGASRRGVAVGVSRDMDRLADELSDRVAFLYGPIGF